MSETLGTRLAVLEQIANHTHEVLLELRTSQKTLETGLRAEMAERRKAGRSDFHWIMGAMLGLFGTMLGMAARLLGVMAKGFHWL